MWMSAKSLSDRPPRHEREFNSLIALAFDAGKPLAQLTCSSSGKLCGVTDQRSVSIEIAPLYVAAAISNAPVYR